MTFIKFSKLHKIILLTGLIGTLTACPDITPKLEISPTTKTLIAGGAAETFSASVKNSNETVKWTLDPNLGTLSTATGSSVQYTPPATVTAATNVKIQADVTGATASASITINPAPVVSLTVSPTAKSVLAGSGATMFTATLTNSTAEISWSLSPNIGTLSATTGGNVEYTPPTSATTATNVTLKASAAGKQASAVIVVNPAGSPAITLTPPTTTVTAGGSGIALTATLVNSSASITWTVTPSTGAGTLSANTGANVTYSPPATVSVLTVVTVTASAAGVSATSSIQVKPATVTVAGKILKFEGTAASGVNVVVQDAAGSKASVTSTSTGAFQVADVVPPYTISALVPGNSLAFTPVTWTNVTRTDPQIVLPYNTSANNAVLPCNRSNGTIAGAISPPVPSGSTGYALFIAEGISRFNLSFDDPSYAYNVGVTGVSSYTLPIVFDKGLCKFDVTGALIYIEKDINGAFTRVRLTKNATVTTGNTTSLNIASLPVSLISISAKLEAPTGAQSAFVYPTPRIDGLTVHCCGSDFVNPFINSIFVQNNATATFDLPSLPGLEYRMHIHGSVYPTQTGVYWSTPASITSTVIMSPLNLIGPTAPVGNLTGISPFTPTFSFNPVAGATLYQVHIYTDQANPQASTIWTGHTTSTSITLPVLGLPARLVSGAYYWSVDALALQSEPTIDALLGGRMIRKSWGFSGSHYYGDDIFGASYNYQGTQFMIP